MQNWQPSATIQVLKERANILSAIRHFFADRHVLEVETPLLSHASITDPHIFSIPATYNKKQTLYLQTSPEFAMKRLLAANSGPIYQICKAFRQGDLGKYHNPEFTILEWYRPGFDHHKLMDEMDELLQVILKTEPAERISYAAAFEKYLGINPHLASTDELEICAKQKIKFVGESLDRNAWLDLLISHCIEPHIGQHNPVFLYDFPVSQAALAKIRPEEPPVASRFEVYFKGIELANGFHELQDANEQRRRFENDLAYRGKHNLPITPIDERFLMALQQGMPDCSGVALGVDRLVMLALGRRSMADVVSFTFENS